MFTPTASSFRSPLLPQVFPDKGEERDITSHALTKEFLIYATSRGTITYFFLPDLAEISEYKHEVAVSRECIATSDVGGGEMGGGGRWRGNGVGEIWKEE